MDLAEPCENPSWSSELYASSHHIYPFHGIHGVQEMQVSVIMAHNPEFVHMLLSGVPSWDYMVKGMLRNPNQYTDLLMIH
jgi:hypothetical protein